MATALTSWYDEVMPKVPGCGLPMALIAIRNAAIEFADRSACLRSNATAVTTVAGTASYALTPASDNTSDVARIIEVKYSTTKVLDPTTELELRERNVDWENESGEPIYWLEIVPGTLVLQPTPSAAVAISRIAIATKPKQTASTVSDTLYNFYKEAISHGAIARLALTPGTPYYNPDLGGFSRTAFDSAIGFANLRQARNGGKPLRARSFYGSAR